MIAHLFQTGLGPYYDGVLHLFVTLEDLMLVLGLSLLSGLSGKKAARGLIFVVPLSWALGGTLGLVSGQPIVPLWLATVTFSAVGGLVAGAVRLPAPALLVLGAVLAGLHGQIGGAEPQQDGAKILIGSIVSVFVLCTLVAAWVCSLRAEWTKIAVRVAGSWFVAIGLLSLGWELKG